MATSSPGPVLQPTVNFGSYSSAPGDLEGVGFGLRVLARLLDYGVVYFVYFAACAAAGVFIGLFVGITGREFPASIASSSWHYYAGGLLGFLVYHWVCEGAHGSTLGKLICGMVVVSDSGGRCGMKAALGRSLAYYIDSLFFGLVAYFSMNDSPRRQRLGDKWNRTMVAKRSDVSPQVLRSIAQFFLVLFIATFVQAVTTLSFIFLKLISGS
jgi:uncharacterized RDD family membrane protein YckC